MNSPVETNSILVVDDDPVILQLMRRILELENYNVFNASNGQDALDMFSQRIPELVLLDVNMPDMDGYTVCERIRETSNVPIIMVTGNKQSNDMLKGFDNGVDDYITKPFSSDELMARVKAKLRRTPKSNQRIKTFYEYDDLRIDFRHSQAFKDGQDLNLTKTEFHMIAYLAKNAGRIVSTEELLIEVWGKENAKNNHLLQVNIDGLRTKLKDSAKNPKYIITRSGIGYMMNRKRLTNKQINQARN